MPASRGYHVWRSVALSTGLNALWPVNPKYRFVGVWRKEHRFRWIFFKGFQSIW